MSNLLKVGTTVTKSERIIDYNDLIKERVEAAREASFQTGSSGFVSGLVADVVEQVEGAEDEDWDMETLMREHAQEPVQGPSEEELKAQAEAMLAEARQEADTVLAQATAEADNIKENAKNDGYQAGIIQAEQEYAQKQQDLENTYMQKQQELEQEYESMKEKLEPALVDTLLHVFENVTHVVAEDNKDIILSLINDAMKHIDNCHEYTIKISPDDYDFVVEHQGKIYCAMTNSVNLDIVQDVSMKKNDCMIETETGVFHCSLDVELENLMKDIKLLSCM